MRPTGEHGRPGKGIDVEPESIARALEKLVDPERVMYDPVRTANYSYDASFATRLQPRRPDVVVQPLTTRETAAVVRWCYEHDVPMYPRGAATAMTGGAVALNGGVVIDMSRMTRIVEVAAQDLQVVCEPGVVHARLNKVLAE